MYHIIILFLFAIGILITNYYYNNKEYFNIKIPEDDFYSFYSKKEACEIFKTDPDAYFENLTPLDLYAMKFNDTQDAIQKMCQESRSFTAIEQDKLTKAMKASDDFFNKINIPYFDAKKCASIPWKLIITKGKINEEGMPHTKKDIIYISDEIVDLDMKMLISVLVHEKVHVYERKYPQLMEEWIKWAGYKLHRKQSSIPHARSNPDVDGWTYIDPKGRETVVLYKLNALPKNILDADYPVYEDPSSEHPYEKLAYMIDHMYTKGKYAL